MSPSPHQQQQQQLPEPMYPSFTCPDGSQPDAAGNCFDTTLSDPCTLHPNAIGCNIAPSQDTTTTPPPADSSPPKNTNQ